MEAGRIIVAATALAALCAAPAGGQEWPTRPLTMRCPAALTATQSSSERARSDNGLARYLFVSRRPRQLK
jgi:hypothetical protein